MTAHTRNLSSKAILHLLNLIADCDDNLAILFQSGESETSLLARQEKHLKYQFCRELNALLVKDKLRIKVVEI